MAKKKSKVKFYAIKDGIGVKDIIVTSWDECSKLVLVIIQYIKVLGQKKKLRSI